MKKNNKFFKLKIIHPQKEDFFDIEWVSVKSPTGDFVIAIDHSPLMSIIKNRSKISYKQKSSSKIDHFDVYGGFISVNNNTAIIVVDI